MAYGESHRIDVEGATLYVEVDGPEGAPAVFMWNGAQCTTHMWDLVVPELSDRFRVIRMDVRGTGQSTPAESEDQYTFEQYADDAVTVLHHFGYEKSIVWSMAWGSRAAVVYAARRPERVQVLALYDASVGRADVAAQREGREKAFAAQAAEGIAPIERPEGWNNNVHKDATNKALAAALRFDNLPGELAKITAPTMVSTGDYDPNIVSSREIAAGIPGARLTVMKNVGHGSILQRPDLATQLFLSFVDEHRARFE